MDGQEVFQRTFNALINDNCSISVDIGRYQDVLKHALQKLDFSIDTSIYMLPSNVNLDECEIQQ